MFLAVFKYGNLTDAAKELHITQSAISMGLKELQNELGEKLFNRTGKRLTPNSSAQSFHEKALSITNLWNEAATLFSKEQITGSLKIGASQTIANYLMPILIFDFKDTFNGVDIDMFVSNTNTVLQKLHEGALDICFVEGEVRGKSFLAEKIAEDELIVVTSNEIFSKRPYFIDELYAKKWILREVGSGTREHVEKTLGGYFKELHIFMELRNNEAIKTVLYKNEDAFSCISRYAVYEEKLFEVSLKNITFRRSFWVVKIQNREETRLQKEFYAFVKHKIGTI